jgi:hypothetical protein
MNFILNHFLNIGARQVIGTEVNSSILSTIPIQAFQIYRDQGQTVDFRVENFEESPMDIHVDIVTMFIGIPSLVYRLLDLFIQNQNIQIIAFMKPNRERAELEEKLNEMMSSHYLSSKTFNIHLSGSGEQRQTIVLKKIPVIDLTANSPTVHRLVRNTKARYKTNKINTRLGLTKKNVSRHFSYRKK